ncbi:MAG: BrnT family toxin [Phormidium tanganyikae FI6-MK23]|nr:BrnT family toxin [Phormidium tanganyikae FI6-MK23]
MWTDSNRIEIPATTEDEQRFLVIGTIAQQHWTAVITYRDENVRIISVRHARDNERGIYESNRI